MNEMTVFYRKSTGDLTDIIQGTQTMAMYGDLKSDYELIYDLMVVSYDDYIMKNPNLFCIVNGVIKLKDSETLQKYM